MFWSLSASTFALIMVNSGDRPVENMGWPRGCEKVANQPGRLGWWEGPPFGGGEYHFEFVCKDTAEFNAVLKAFAAIQVPGLPAKSASSASGENTYRDAAQALELVVHDGPEYSAVFDCEGAAADKKKSRVDWTFTVWNPANWYRLFNSPNLTFESDHHNFRQPVAPPRIDVYIGGGTIVWNKVKVPPNVHVVDKREEAAPVRPKGGGLVRGTVYDMATGQPIAGAEIVVARGNDPRELQEVARTNTDNRGLGEVEKIPSGRYAIVVRAAGYAARVAERYENKAATYHEFTAMLAPEAAVKGTVADAEGKPITDVQVSPASTLAMDGLGYACSDVKAAMTDKEGRFEIRSLPEGFTQLRCRAPSLHQETFVFELYGVPSEGIKIVMTGTGVVRGKVIGRDGKPAPGATHVSIGHPGGDRVGQWGGSMQCKGDGTFEFQGVPPGEYLVGTNPLLSIKGEDPNAKRITVKAGQTVEVEIVQ